LEKGVEDVTNSNQCLTVMLAIVVLAGGSSLVQGAKRENEKAQAKMTPLDEYIQQASQRGSAGPAGSPGSLYSSTARLAEPVRDLRAFQLDDVVTILVSDRASAISRGATASARESSASASVTSALGQFPAAGALPNLINGGGKQKLDGQGETTRESSLSTTLSARVVHVLPNGNLVVEGTKQISVNSERQNVRVRGVARWNDITSGNSISSDRLAQLEVSIDGRGVVNDAIRRPNVLYRILLGLLPF
jgi:flagellar L-ring protein FlgH